MSVLALECFSAFETGNLYPNSAQAEFVGFGSQRLVRYGFLDAKAEFGGFGSWLLESHGFLCAKAPLRPGFAKKTAFLSAKAQNSRIRRSRILGLYADFLFYQQPCAKAQEFCKAEFLDSMSVLALECFSAFETGIFFPNSAPLNSGLWLGAFGKVWHFRCQSTPGPPMLCFLIWNRQSVSEFSGAEFGALAWGVW